MAVISPFAIRATREEALMDANLVNASSSQGSISCMCTSVTRINHLYPNVPCSLENTCMFRTEETRYVQRIGWVYGYAGDALLAIGSLSLLLTLGGTIILFVDVGVCGKSKEVEIAYRNAHKEYPEGEL